MATGTGTTDFAANVVASDNTSPDGLRRQVVVLGKPGSNANQSDLDTLLGATNETAPASDTAASGHSGRLQRIAQRLTSLIALLPAALGASGGLKIEAADTTNGVLVNTELSPNNVVDHDTGAGTVNAAALGLLIAASGGPTLVSAVNPLPTTATLTGAAAYTPYRTFQTSAAVISALVSATVRRVGYLHAFNVDPAPVYIRLYDKATAPATTDTPVWSGVIPGNTSGAGIALPIPDGLLLANGLGVRVTAAIADNDNTALVANTVMVNLGYRTS